MEKWKCTLCPTVDFVLGALKKQEKKVSKTTD
jgi:hypothetical protein